MYLRMKQEEEENENEKFHLSKKDTRSDVWSEWQQNKTIACVCLHNL